MVDLVPPEPKVFPVGRLDADSEGLLLLTNDGELANLVTHPRYGITKTYNLMVDGRPDASTLRRLEEGVELDDGSAAAVSARLLGSSGRRSHLELTMERAANARSAACSMSGIGCSPCSVPP